MTSEQIRQSFIDFFKSKGHAEVTSESLMPSSPNLLFTNAGMNQFVPYFLGDRPAPFPSAVDTQKCVRAGGKHNDLEDVGFDTYHHTFFEMLGNWSFGDYFKKEAIEWAWELLTVEWKFPKDRLYATVYKPAEGDPAEFDQEAYDIWKGILSKEGLDPEVHIVYGNKKDNFWMMGDTGPCGPCSEIHVDLTPKGDTRGRLVNKSSPYCIEIWNLVFIQMNAQADGSFVTLKEQHVDTGMGLERVAGIIATTKNFTDYSQAPSNYNSDLFTDIFDKITELSGLEYGYTMPEDADNLSEQELRDCSFRVLGDHIRTLSFSIADGILLGNEGRNYVLRRILRRAILWGKHLNLPDSFFEKLIDVVINKMGKVFPELKKNHELIHKVIRAEEQSFEKTLDRGLQLLDKVSEKGKISGKDAFTLYDTYGFPIDLTQLVAREKKLEVDIEGFNSEMEMQRERARAAQKKSIITVASDEEHPEKTIFEGFEPENLSGYKTTFLGAENVEGKVYYKFDKSNFYAEMGGQVGDRGTVEFDGNMITIIDTVKNAQGVFLHEVNEPKAHPREGEEVILNVNTNRRLSLERHHTATHLLHWALRKVLGDHVGQAGSLVEATYLRFDFSHFEGVKQEQLEEIEQLVNEKIIENSKVSWYEVPFNEKPENCIAFFGEKYGSVVRVVDVGGFSVELCGGTHVQATGQIGPFRIKSESAISAGTRRIEAICGHAALKAISENFQELSMVARKLSCQPNEVLKRISQHIEEKAAIEKELRKYQQKGAAAQTVDLLAKAQSIDGLSWIVSKVDVANPNDMRGLAVSLSQKIGPGCVVLGGIFGDKANILALCSPEAIAKGLAAGQIVQELTAKLGGKGGGKPDFAMGGASNIGALEETLANYTSSGVKSA